METTVVLNNVLKTNIAIITFFFGIQNKFYTILFVAMVTKNIYFKLILRFCYRQPQVVLTNVPKTNILLPPSLFASSFIQFCELPWLPN